MADPGYQSKHINLKLSEQLCEAIDAEVARRGAPWTRTSLARAAIERLLGLRETPQDEAAQ